MVHPYAMREEKSCNNTAREIATNTKAFLLPTSTMIMMASRLWSSGIISVQCHYIGCMNVRTFMHHPSSNGSIIVFHGSYVYTFCSNTYHELSNYYGHHNMEGTKLRTGVWCGPLVRHCLLLVAADQLIIILHVRLTTNRDHVTFVRDREPKTCATFSVIK